MSGYACEEFLNDMKDRCIVKKEQIDLALRYINETLTREERKVVADKLKELKHTDGDGTYNLPKHKDSTYNPPKPDEIKLLDNKKEEIEQAVKYISGTLSLDERKFIADKLKELKNTDNLDKLKGLIDPEVTEEIDVDKMTSSPH